jgi:hypothetical protein
MRAITAGQLTDLGARDRKELVRVKVANAAGSLTDLSSSFLGGSLSATLDAMAVSGTLNFWREQATGSLAPLMNASAPIAPGRQVTVEVAVIGTGDSVAAGDWVMLFDGFVDDVGWGGEDATITVPVRDKAGQLRDTWIETPTVYGNDATPVAMETVMQSILDDTLGTDEVVLETVGDPDFGIVLYQQQRQSLADALAAHRDLIGWDLRYLWDDTEEDFLLTFYEPDRTKTEADHTFTADDYFNITEIAKTGLGVRNVIQVRYADDISVTAVDDASVAEFGRRFMFLDFINNSQISNEASALVLAAAVLADCSQPPLTHTSENALWWPVELGDLYQFVGNEVHYSSAVEVAVAAYTHTFSPDGNTTSLQCRGKPAGGSGRWFTRGQLAKQPLDEQMEEATLGEKLGAYYTTAVGSYGFSQVQEVASDSRGGYISITKLTDGINDLFRGVTETERTDSITLYRSFGVINQHETLTWEGVLAWLTDVGQGGVNWAITLDPEGVDAYDRVGMLSARSPDEETPPTTSPALSWYSPDSIVHADVLNIGDVAPGEGFIVHVRLDLDETPDPTPQITDTEIVFSNTVDT